jgi:hypothetical protein
MYFQNVGGLAMYETSIYQKRRAVIIYFNYHTKLKHIYQKRSMPLFILSHKAKACSVVERLFGTRKKTRQPCLFLKNIHAKII